MEFSNQDIRSFKTIIESIIDAKIKNKRITTYVSAIVKKIDSNGKVSVVIPPELESVVTGLLNKTGEVLNVGDSVELVTKNGLLSNSWVALKHKTNNDGTSNFIEEYASIDNISYIKYSNGIMIQYGNVIMQPSTLQANVQQIISGGYNSGIYNIVFPQSFADNNYAVSLGLNNKNYFSSNYDVVNNNSINVSVLAINNNFSLQANVSFLAIGKWK